MRLIWALLTLVSFIRVGWTKYNIDDSAFYGIKFNPRDDNDMLNAPDIMQTVTMTTSHNEKYVCQLPNEEDKIEENRVEYTGPNVLQLLERLFVQSKCAHRLEHYWTYELCHGKHLKQYHEEREGKNTKTTEYFLGFYSKETLDESKTELIKKLEEKSAGKPLRKKIEAMHLPYVEILMDDGTICDLNGKPRTTRVQYVCYPGAKDEIYSLKETSTCEYEVVVLTTTICAHPDFRLEQSKERVVSCRPANDESATKPLNLIALEAESLKLRSENMFQAELFQGDTGPGSVRIEIKPVIPVEGTAAVTIDEIEEAAAAANKDENWPEPNPRQPMKPLMDPQVVQEFLLGQYCLYGGSGWWKFEFCYGQKVDQYHEEKGKTKATINLGRFDVEKHKEWIRQNPSKRPKPVETRKHVSHLYSGGDICDITGKPRHVEVKLKCKKSDSPSAVSIYLSEPKTCEYILGVESPLVCDILSSADEFGLMKMSSKADFSTTTTTESTRNFVKFTLEDALPMEDALKFARELATADYDYEDDQDEDKEKQ